MAAKRFNPSIGMINKYKSRRVVFVFCKQNIIRPKNNAVTKFGHAPLEREASAVCQGCLERLLRELVVLLRLRSSYKLWGGWRSIGWMGVLACVPFIYTSVQ